MPYPMAGDSTESPDTLSEEKYATLDRVATEQAAAKTGQPTRPSDPVAIQPSLTIAAIEQTGIIENPSVPFHSGDVRIENAWKSGAEAGYIIVYAGWLPKEPEQGIVIVYSDSTHAKTRHLTPQKNGSVRIVDVSGSKLILQSQDGETFYFDFLALQFVSSLDIVLPTATAIPPESGLASPSVIGTPYP
jgi:hypothetical protein